MIEIDLGKPHLTLAALAFICKMPGWYSSGPGLTNKGLVGQLAMRFGIRFGRNESFFVKEDIKGLQWNTGGEPHDHRITTWSDFQLLAALLGEDNGIPSKTVKQNLTMLRRISQAVLEDKGIT